MLRRIHLRGGLEELLFGLGARRSADALVLHLLDRWATSSLQASLNSAAEGPTTRFAVECLVNVEFADRLGVVPCVGRKRVLGVLRDKDAGIHVGVRLCGRVA